MSAAVVESEMKTDLMIKEDLDDVDGPRVANGDIEVDVDDSMSSKMEKDGSDSEDYEKYKHSTPFAQFAAKHFNGNDSAFDLEMRQKFGIGRDDSLSPETSKLLREILQSRERRMQLHLAAAGKLPLGFPNGNDNLMAKLYQRDPSSFHNGELDLDMSVLQQMGHQRNEGSSDESDQDIDKNQNKRSAIDSECSSPCVTSEQLSPSDGYEGNCPEAKLLKRARVENIITSMQLSPIPKSDPALTPPLEARRKRKQCQPMQHEGAKEDDPPANKVRRMEREDIRQQLTHMQQQLMEMQQKYLTLFDKDQSEAPDNTSDLENGDTKDKSTKVNQNGIDKKDEKKSEKRRGWPVFGLDDEVEPHQFIDKVRKLVKEQEYVSRDDIDFKNMNLDQLAKLLKNEIRDAISTTVDSVVTKFLNQTSKTKTPSQTPLTDAANKLSTISSHHDHPKIEHPKPSKPKVTDRHAFRPPELIPNGFAEALHPLHPHHTFPPLSFFPQAFQPPPHLPTYPKKEPEQTEALSLVVNTPKKKRTKVTDTRLSPRAARALLHEPPTSESDKPQMMMHIPHHHDIYPPIVPVTLPTSVAIPNPSLQHSDVLSMYSHTEHGGTFHESSHSPPVGDHMSPSGAHTPLEGLQLSMTRQSEQSESSFERSHCETPTYEASMQHMISFFNLVNNPKISF
jgi:hypothetical protein